MKATKKKKQVVLPIVLSVGVCATSLGLAINSNPLTVYANDAETTSSSNNGPVDKATPIQFKDKNLEAALVEQLKKKGVTKAQDITIAKAEKVDALYLDEKKITNLDGLQYFTNLTYLSLEKNNISDIQELKGLTNLTELQLADNKISNIAMLDKLINLDHLGLDNNLVSDISIVKQLTNLTWFSISNNKVSDVSPMGSLTNLEDFNLTNNSITDISPLKGLTGPTEIDNLDISQQKIEITSNQITNNMPIKGGNDITYTLKTQDLGEIKDGVFTLKQTLPYESTVEIDFEGTNVKINNLTLGDRYSGTIVLKLNVPKEEIIKGKMQYVANESLTYNEHKKITDPRDGKTITYKSGSKKEETKAVDGKTEVGNKEVIQNANGTVTTKIYQVDPNTGTLSNPTETTTSPAPEPELVLTNDVTGAQVGKELRVELPFTSSNIPADATFEGVLTGDGSEGLKAEVSTDKTKVTITGTPKKAGNATLTLSAKKGDTTLKTATKEFSVTAATPAPNPPAPAPVPPAPAPVPVPNPTPQPGEEPSVPSFDQATKRIAGETAEDTMQQIVQTAFPDPVDKVVLATSESYWDALSANSLAGSLNAPVLLTHHNQLPAQTIAELKRLKTSKVVVCGGENAISNDVVAQLKGLNIEVERVAGQMASDTANDIAKKLANTDTAVVATSWGYEDALSAASFAYAKKAPIFLANYNSATLDASSIQTMKDKGVKKVYIVGGTSVVSPEVEAQLQEAGITVERIAGETAYDTSAKLATTLISLGMSANNMAIATGWGYTDALAGAALCGKQNSVMVLADNTNQTAINDVVAANKNAIQNYYIFGGTSVVGDGATDALKGVFTGKDA